MSKKTPGISRNFPSPQNPPKKTTTAGGSPHPPPSTSNAVPRKDVSMGDLEDLDVEWDDLEEDNEEDQPGLGWMSRTDGQDGQDVGCRKCVAWRWDQR